VAGGGTPPPPVQNGGDGSCRPGIRGCPRVSKMRALAAIGRQDRLPERRARVSAGLSASRKRLG